MALVKTLQMPLRIPARLHEELKESARHEGLSLNQYCLYLLARYSVVPESQKTKKMKTVLRFFQEANAFQHELNKKRKLPPREELPKETPLQRWRYLYAKH